MPRPANPEITLSFLVPADIPELLTLWREAGLSIRPAGREHPDQLRAEMTAYPDNFIGARCDDRLVGVVIASWDGRRAWINRLAVHPHCRGQGLGRKLIEAAETELRRRGARVIAVLIEPDNEGSLTLFERVGYRRTPAALYLSKRDRPDV